MKIKKQLYCNILIFIIYYAFFILSTIDFSNYNEIQYPTAISTFVLLTSIYVMLFINRRSLLFYTISAIVIPLIGVISTYFSKEFHWGVFEDRLNFYNFQYVIFFISCCCLMILINKIFKKTSFVNGEEYIFIKGVNYISVVLLFIILIASVLQSINQYTNFFRNYYYSENYNESVASDTADVPVEVPMDEHPNYEEGDEESNEEEISTYSLASLWDNPADDEKIIQDLIIYYIDSYLPLDGQGSLAHINDNHGICKKLRVTTEEEDDELLKDYEDDNLRTLISNSIKIKNKINRDPIIMKSVFYTYKHLLYKSLSRKNYYKADVNNYVDILILSYKDIHTQDDPKSVLISLHEIATLNYDDEDYERLPTLDEIISDDYEREYRNIYYGNGTKVRDEDLFWAYTFWARRNKENNVKEVYDVLVEVQNHYAE